MRRKNFVILLLFVSICTVAQGRKQLDSLQYILPEFSRGAVIFSDKQISSGMLNISPLDQSVYCISGKDTLYAEGNPNVIRVSVSGRSFVKWNDSFVEIILEKDNTGVGIIRKTLKVNNVRAGAYDMNSSTSFAKTYSVNASSGTLHNLTIDDPRNYVYTKTPYLFINGKYYRVSKKSFEKLFPKLKDFIERVWEERNVGAVDIAAVISFYNELQQK